MSEMRRAVVKNADMSDEMQQDAVDVSTAGLGKHGIEKDVAAHIKKEFDKKYTPLFSHLSSPLSPPAFPNFFSVESPFPLRSPSSRSPLLLPCSHLFSYLLVFVTSILML
jgi:hypothetical protein